MFVSSYASVNGYNQLVLENIRSDGGDTVKLGGIVVVNGSIPNTWVRGQMVSWRRLNSSSPSTTNERCSIIQEIHIHHFNRVLRPTRLAHALCSVVKIISS